MQEERGYFIWPRGPLRIGVHADDLALGSAYPSADTLFGAICWAIRQVEGTPGLERWLAPFIARKPPVLLTSALPTIRLDGVKVACVPVPVRRPGFAPETLPDRKMIRRARFLDISLLGWFDGNRPAQAGHPVRVGPLIASADHARLLVDASSEAGSFSAPWVESTSRPRVTVDRASGAAALFNAGYAYFAHGDRVRVGMLLGVLVRDRDVVPSLDQAMHLLAETGIGGERSTGSGGFDLEVAACPMPLTEDPRGMLLSLCCPTAADLEAGALDPPPGSGYRLVERSGWISSPDWHGYRSRTVTMLAEGSHVGRSLSGPIGGLVDVTPDPGEPSRHPVYRFGFACFLDEGRLR